MSPSNSSLVSLRGSSGGLFPSQMQRATLRELERTVGEGLVVRTREQARGALTNEVLETAGALTALESHLIQIAPLGEARYRAIVDSYVMGAATSIARL